MGKLRRDVNAFEEAGNTIKGYVEQSTFTKKNPLQDPAIANTTNEHLCSEQATRSSNGCDAVLRVVLRLSADLVE